MNIGIPTHLNGRQYRSRLEARWARFFDLLHWKYEYEPYDLNGWIPDFALYGAKQEILVEVKPYYRLDQFDLDKLIGAIRKTEKEGTEILLLGSTIFNDVQYMNCSILGWLGEWYQWEDSETQEIVDGTYGFDKAIFNRYAEWGFYHANGSWHDRITGLYDGDAFISWPSFEEIQLLWNQAGNTVQWFPNKQD